jgi:NitT/TauT family transport system substrate-binding protein
MTRVAALLHRSPVALFAFALALGLVAGCTPNGSGSSPSAPGASGVGASSSTTPLSVGLGYIPSVQFAPFYLADRAGYYRDAGLAVTFQNKIDPDLVTLVGQGAIDIGLSDGTSVIPAVSQGIPIRYVATIYGTFPSIVFAKASSGIKSAADLRGKKIGIPGMYGSSWIMLQALLKSASMKPADVQVELYPDFGQGAAVQQGAVAAATGFVNNEPVQLELAGEKAVILHVDDVVPLPGPGLIAGNRTLETKHEAIAAFVEATLKAMNEIVADPSKGLDASIAAVPELGADRTRQAAILAATISSWSGPLTQDEGLGAIDDEGWAKSIEYMTELGLVPNSVKVPDVIDKDFLPAQG